VDVERVTLQAAANKGGSVVLIATPRKDPDNVSMISWLRFSCSRPRVLAVCVFLVLSFFHSSAADDTVADTKDFVQQVDAYVNTEVQQHFFRGAVLVGRDGKIIFEKGYGLADEEWGAPNSPTTKFRIASLTKQFSAACILLLQERGLLHVEDPISRYLSGLPEAWQSITVHQLLTHTSGIHNYTDSPQMKKLDRTGATPRELIALVEDRPLDFKPGTKWSYSNTGYILLGMIIEKLSGQSYAEFLKTNVFDRLKMANSGYDRATDVLKERASGYDANNGRIANADFIDMSVPFAAGGIYSTVEDLYIWNEALTQEGKLLSAASLKQMFTEYPEAASQGQHYGYGVVISRLKFGKLLYYHGGGVEGFSSSIQRYPEQGVCIIVLSNLSSYRPWELGDQVAAKLFHQPLPAAH
jgi:CubicO group peptidase (beta-lactamase class C family)